MIGHFLSFLFEFCDSLVCAGVSSEWTGNCAGRDRFGRSNGRPSVSARGGVSTYRGRSESRSDSVSSKPRDIPTGTSGRVPENRESRQPTRLLLGSGVTNCVTNSPTTCFCFRVECHTHTHTHTHARARAHTHTHATQRDRSACSN